MINDTDNITGYIEGFYGRLLDWESRKLIVKSLKKNKMNTYLYAPKEDINHRLKWRNKYNSSWRKSFKDFSKYCKNKNIKLIAGIAPGLDFDFSYFNNKSTTSSNTDFKILCQKAKQLLTDGATSIVLLLDDIPNNFSTKFGNKHREGKSHAILANKLSDKLGEKIYFVPRVYADELVSEEPEYLSDVSKTLKSDIEIFYCGKYVVSSKLDNKVRCKKKFKNKFIYWDNYFANDYCPRRLFVGPYLGRKRLKNFMINPTGLLNTDLLILDIVSKSQSSENNIKDWINILTNHGVPLQFQIIKNFFLKPNFGSNPSLTSFNATKKHLDAIDYLLWNWKTPLSREWYSFLFGLKHDININQKKLTTERLIKTQTLPLSCCIYKNLTKGVK